MDSVASHAIALFCIAHAWSTDTSDWLEVERGNHGGG